MNKRQAQRIYNTHKTSGRDSLFGMFARIAREYIKSQEPKQECNIRDNKDFAELRNLQISQANVATTSVYKMYGYYNVDGTSHLIAQSTDYKRITLEYVEYTQFSHFDIIFLYKLEDGQEYLLKIFEK